MQDFEPGPSELWDSSLVAFLLYHDLDSVSEIGEMGAEGRNQFIIFQSHSQGGNENSFIFISV
jgi:hypothetical protein